jgi:hypothetical protein
MSHRNFPIRVNRKDAERQRFPSRNPDSDIKVFAPGARHYLHPKLAILDRLDCELAYYRQHKILVVSYAPKQENIDHTDYTHKVYEKGILTTDVNYVVELIREYLDDLKKEQEGSNDSINSDIRNDSHYTTEEQVI